MSKEAMVKNNEIKMWEQNIIFKILQLLAQEKFISLEEKIRGEEEVRGGIPGC